MFTFIPVQPIHLSNDYIGTSFFRAAHLSSLFSSCIAAHSLTTFSERPLRTARGPITTSQAWRPAPVFPRSTAIIRYSVIASRVTKHTAFMLLLLLLLRASKRKERESGGSFHFLVPRVHTHHIGTSDVDIERGGKWVKVEALRFIDRRI